MTPPVSYMSPDYTANSTNQFTASSQYLQDHAIFLAYACLITNNSMNYI